MLRLGLGLGLGMGLSVYSGDWTGKRNGLIGRHSTNTCSAKAVVGLGSSGQANQKGLASTSHVFLPLLLSKIGGELSWSTSPYPLAHVPPHRPPCAPLQIPLFL